MLAHWLSPVDTQAVLRCGVEHSINT